MFVFGARVDALCVRSSELSSNNQTYKANGRVFHKQLMASANMEKTQQRLMSNANKRTSE